MEDALLQDVAARIIQHYWQARPRRTRWLCAPADEQRSPTCASQESRAAERLRSLKAGRGLARPPKPPARPGSAAVGQAQGGAGRWVSSNGSSKSRLPSPPAASSKGRAAEQAEQREGPKARRALLSLEDSAEQVDGSSSGGGNGEPAKAAAIPAAVVTAVPPLPRLQGQDTQQAANPQAPPRTAGGCSGAAAQGDPLRASAASTKMASLLHFLDAVEAKASEDEAVAQLSAHPLALQLARQPASLSSRHLAAAAAVGGDGAAQDLAAAGGSRVVGSCAAMLGEICGGIGAVGDSTASVRQDHGAAPVQLQVQALRTGGADAGMVDATAVAEGVRAKIQRLQQQLAARDQQVAQLAAESQRAQQAHEQALAAALAQHQAQLVQQRTEHEATVGRNLKFIDQLMADKDALGKNCGKLSQELAGAQAEAARQVEALKEGLAKELRKQREAAAAAERAKREAWMVEQTRAIKEATVRGLEPEIQRLVDSHKAELKRAEHRAEVECSRRLAAATAAHEEALGRLRAQAAAERAAAVDMEKAAGREALKVAQQRFEGALQDLRLQLAASHQLQLERVEAGRREDRALAAERAEGLARAHEQRLVAARAEAAEERAALGRLHQRELEALRDKYETGQEAWRAAVAERAKQEASAQEGALRCQLATERDAELRAVVARLEEEALAKEEAQQAEVREKEAAAEARWAGEVSRLRGAEAALQEQLQAAEGRAAAGEERLAQHLALLGTLNQELASKAKSLSWLEEQLEAARRESAGKDGRLREALAEQAAAAAAERAALERQLGGLQAQVDAAKEAEDAARRRKEEELGALEARVQAALAKKDKQVAALREQLAQISRQLAEEGEEGAAVAE